MECFVYSEPWHFQNLRNISIYDALFFQELSVTPAYLELWYMQSLRNNQNPVKHVYDVAFS